MTSASPTRTAPEGAFDRRLLSPMMLGSILNPVNSSIIAVALVPIATSFGAPASQTAWLISALYLATAIGQPLVGRLVDTFGPRRLLVAGAVLTGIAGVLGVLAPNIGVLIAARVILGFGTCAGYPASMSLIRSEANRTGIASPAGVLTALAVTTQTIAVIGPTLGGLLIGVGGWRATFAVNIPLAVASLVLALLFVPRATSLEASDGAQEQGHTPSLRLDYPGILLFAATLVALLLFLMNVGLAWSPLLLVAAAAGTGFTLRELRTADPFIDVRVFAGNAPLLVTYARGFLAATVSYCFLYGFTQWLEDGRGLEPSEAGLLLLPTFAVGILVSTLTGRRPEIRGKLLVGACVQVVMCALMLLVHAQAAIPFLVVIALITGVPQGLNNLAVQNALYYQADPARIGASSGLLRTFMYLGAIAASSASGAFFGARATTGGLHELAWFMLGAAVIFVAITVADRSLGRISRENRRKAEAAKAGAAA
ncbi:MFS transporter [Frondihabitans australicus]|uniref:MFS transporter n=1 Tax=Frondihabitans australicus TaxID=386892 RepID=A0A495IKW4_9MICO|nr:MFS transporter [Frondihabitans australicus]RKR75765.1 MFS transporter [Frondihabitans australicus]